MQKIIEGSSFDDGDTTKSFEGNILGEKWKSINARMMEKMQKSQGHDQLVDDEALKERLMKSRSLKSEKKNKFIVVRKRVKSQIKIENQNRMIDRKKLEEQQKQAKRIREQNKLRNENEEKNTRKDELAVKFLQKNQKLVVSHEVRVRSIQMNKEKQNICNRKKLQNFLMMHQQKINLRLPQLKKLKIENHLKRKKSTAKQNFQKLLIVQKCQKTQGQ